MVGGSTKSSSLIYYGGNNKSKTLGKCLNHPIAFFQYIESIDSAEPVVTIEKYFTHDVHLNDNQGFFDAVIAAKFPEKKSNSIDEIPKTDRWVLVVRYVRLVDNEV
mgnify:CR=1 FL=1